jgi:hypothetical protein
MTRDEFVNRLYTLASAPDKAALLAVFDALTAALEEAKRERDRWERNHESLTIRYHSCDQSRIAAEAALQSARTEALEEAARAVDDSGNFGGEYSWIAERVRSLPRPDAEGKTKEKP